MCVKAFWHHPRGFQGQIQDLVRGSAKVTQWRMRRHFTWTFPVVYVWLDVIAQIFLAPPVKTKKRSQLTASRIMAYHLAFLKLLKLLCALTIGQSLAKITRETCPAVQCLF